MIRRTSSRGKIFTEKPTMSTTLELPPRREVNEDDTWDLSSLFPSDEAWEEAFVELVGVCRIRAVGDFAHRRQIVLHRLRPQPQVLTIDLGRQLHVEICKIRSRVSLFRFRDGGSASVQELVQRRKQRPGSDRVVAGFGEFRFPLNHSTVFFEECIDGGRFG